MGRGLFARAAELCNDAALEENGAIGEPTEAALVNFAAAQGLKSSELNAVQADKYASRVLSDAHKNEKLLTQDELSRFYWIARNMGMGTGNWSLSSQAGFWSSAFTYQLEWRAKNNGNNRDTYYAVLKVWPGEWEEIQDEEKFPPYVFYREIVPYPDL